MTAPGAQGPRVVIVGGDGEVCAALHGALDHAGHALWCLPSPADLDPVLRLAAPQLIVLVLPAAPDASWGSALTSTASAARVGVRVVVVAPSREVVEPLAAVAGAERALSRAEVIARPLVVLASSYPARTFETPIPAAVPAAPRHAPPVEPAIALSPQIPQPPPPPSTPVAITASAPPPPALVAPGSVPRPPRVQPDLASLIDEELEDEPRNRPRPARVEVNVSLVSQHNFYVGATKRVDSGGVFIATAMPPPVGTRLQIRLGLADGRKLDLEGEVAFVFEKSALGQRQASGCGVRLLGIPGWAVDAIERFVQARPPIVWTAR